MEIEVGMYVRTKNGEIGKIRVIIDNKIFINTNQYYSTVVKASYNIIDLIEEKDLVEIEYYSLRKNERVTRLFEVSFKEGIYINLSNAKCEFMLINGEFNEEDKELKPIIKTIVTKEQFESMSYKVGE